MLLSCTLISLLFVQLFNYIKSSFIKGSQFRNETEFCLGELATGEIIDHLIYLLIGGQGEIPLQTSI